MIYRPNNCPIREDTMSKININEERIQALEEALYRNGLYGDHYVLDWLADGSNLKKVNKMRLAEIGNNINCNVEPYIPSDSYLVEHRSGGIFTWDMEAQKSALWIHQEQREEEGVCAARLVTKLLTTVPVLNANVLDHLIENPHAIPKEWEPLTVSFPGTIYARRVGHTKYVRGLHYSRGRWTDCRMFLYYNRWGQNKPLAIPARDEFLRVIV
jgi:hypothetical protein